MSEDERIQRLAAIFGSAAREGNAEERVRVGIGDDAAVLGDGLVLTVDTHVEDVHFRRAWLSMRELGARSFMAAASDIAAMGARPTWAVSSLILPADVTDEGTDELARGQADAARELGIAVVGGNLARGPFSITTTVLGHASTPLLRSGAKAGDLLLLGGSVGLAGAGLRALMNGVPGADGCVASWRRPRALVELGRALVASGASACIDVSDGVALDLHRLCEASGIGACVDAHALLATTPTLGAAARLVSADALELALRGGEDYALLATAKDVVPGFAVIGRITGEREVVLTRADGAREPLSRTGFQHF